MAATAALSTPLGTSFSCNIPVGGGRGGGRRIDASGTEALVAPSSSRLAQAMSCHLQGLLPSQVRSGAAAPAASPENFKEAGGGAAAGRTAGKQHQQQSSNIPLQKVVVCRVVSRDRLPLFRAPVLSQAPYHPQENEENTTQQDSATDGPATQKIKVKLSMAQTKDAEQRPPLAAVATAEVAQPRRLHGPSTGVHRFASAPRLSQGTGGGPQEGVAVKCVSDALVDATTQTTQAADASVQCDAGVSDDAGRQDQASTSGERGSRDCAQLPCFGGSPSCSSSVRGNKQRKNEEFQEEEKDVAEDEEKALPRASDRRPRDTELLTPERPPLGYRAGKADSKFVFAGSKSAVSFSMMSDNDSRLSTSTSSTSVWETKPPQVVSPKPPARPVQRLFKAKSALSTLSVSLLSDCVSAPDEEASSSNASTAQGEDPGAEAGSQQVQEDEEEKATHKASDAAISFDLCKNGIGRASCPIGMPGSKQHHLSEIPARVAHVWRPYRMVALDFDLTLTTVMVGFPSESFTKDIQETSAEDFGGSQRVEMLRRLLRILHCCNVHVFILSFGWLDRVRTALQNVSLLEFFKDSDLVCRETPELLQHLGSKLSVMQARMSKFGLRPHEAILIDDSQSNLQGADSVCTVFQAGTTEPGLSTEEIRSLTNAYLNGGGERRLHQRLVNSARSLGGTPHVPLTPPMGPPEISGEQSPVARPCQAVAMLARSGSVNLQVGGGVAPRRGCGSMVVPQARSGGGASLVVKMPETTTTPGLPPRHARHTQAYSQLQCMPAPSTVMRMSY